MQQLTDKDYDKLYDEHEAMLKALRVLVRWATGGDKHKNPYCYPEVKQALQAIAKVRGRKDWMDAND